MDEAVLFTRQTNQSIWEEIFSIMDDLTTTERSRWEVWAGVYHGKFSRTFEEWLQEEHFIKANQDSNNKSWVRWVGPAADWYPTAIQIVHQLITDPNPTWSLPLSYCYHSHYS